MINLGKGRFYDKGLFSCGFGWTLQILPFIYEEYSKKGIEPKFEIKSMIYGLEPSFDLIGDVLIEKNEPTKIDIEKNIDIRNYFFEKCGLQDCDMKTLDTLTECYSYKNNFEFANKMFFYYFDFHERIYQKLSDYQKLFSKKKVLGIHFRGTDKRKCKWATDIDNDYFIKIIDNEINENKYEILFYSTDSLSFSQKLNNYFENKIYLVYLNENRSEKPMHLSILNNDEKIDKKTNTDNTILNSLILSLCTKVIKNHSQLSSFAKVFNPKLDINRVTASKNFYWPECNIKKYQCQNQEINNYLNENQFKYDIDLKLMNYYQDFNKKRIIIITPAIPRPDLHTKCIGSFYKNLFLSEKFDEIIHIINIDSPKKIIQENKDLIDKTIKNFNEIIPDNVEKVIINEGNSDFCEAYKRIFLEANNYLNEDSCLIYLEDDWEFLMIDDIGKNIKKFCFYPNVIYSLSTISISNNPIVYGFNHAKTIINFIKNKKLINIDPDYILRPLKLPSMNKRVRQNSILKIYFNPNDKLKKYGLRRIEKYANYIYYEKQDTLYEELDSIKINKNYDVNFISNIINYKNCIDKGREWLENKNIQKWNKDEDSKKTY